MRTVIIEKRIGSFEELVEKDDCEGIAALCDFLYDRMGELSPDGVYFGGHKNV